MVEIGANLKYERFEFMELNGSVLKVRNACNQIQQLDLKHLKSIDIIGIKSKSGYCGTMEWGMSNPTFILPINFIYNIINLFKRRNDIVHLKVALENGKEFIIVGNNNLYTKLQEIKNNNNKLT